MFPTWGLEPRRGFGGPFVAMLLVLSSVASGYDLNPNSTESVKTIAKSMVENLMTFYHGDEPGHTPGLLPDPYYWWEAGAMMGTLIEYWFYTGDDEYVNTTKQALLFQVGEYDDYMPINQTRTEGNDDQGFWGLAVMSAAEYNFPHPQESEPQWLALAQAVFNTQAARWDTEHCGGGLRWQIFQWNNGYNYKNSISQACFFALGARLALFTGNNTYADWADKTWDWMVKVEFINEEKNWAVYDGAHIETGCTNIVPYQFSYNVGGFILGAAAMYNHTESEVWKDRLDNLIEGVKVFFTGPDDNIMAEVACEPVKLCNIDQQSFKAYLTRWLAVTTQWAPHTADIIRPLLRTSAVAAAKQCVGGDNEEMCGMIWTQDKYDGSTGVGQQMAAIEITLSCMIGQRGAPLTADTGGTSKGDSGAGSEDIGRTEPNRNWRKITAGDKAGAAILTTLVIGLLVFGVGWLMVDEQSERSAADQFNGFC
ncbi:glycoside hydrolase family 76 protein, partial [Dactylonectria macrodidyma]